MGIFGALTTAVTGMQAQSFALQNISGNIANSQTTAYKRTDTSFQDLIQDGEPSKQVSGSVMASSRATNTVQGDVQTSSIGTFMAINGDGFFVVMKPTRQTDNHPGCRRRSCGGVTTSIGRSRARRWRSPAEAAVAIDRMAAGRGGGRCAPALPAGSRGAW
jgi:hypothetical protein